MKLSMNFSRKALALLLALVMLITALSVNLVVMAGADTGGSSDPLKEGVKGVVWNGETATGFAGGTGTASDPYLIATPNQLAYLLQHDVIATADNNSQSASMGKYYKLTANIYLNDVSDPNWKENDPHSWFTTAGSQRFGGTLDGDGYTIYGLYYKGDQDFGLFPYTDVWSYDVTFKNLTLSDAYIDAGGNFVGAFVGYNYGGSGKARSFTVSNCYLTNSVTVIASGGTVGGFLGCARNANDNYTVENSAVLATVSGSYTGAFSGWYYDNNNVTICNSFSHKSFCNSGVVDKQENSYAISDLSAIKGAAAKTEMPELKWDSVWVLTDSYPVLKDAKPAHEIWDGTVAQTYAAGSGTADDPYWIADGAQLALMLHEGDNSKGKFYTLAAHIYLNDTTVADWKNGAPRSWYSLDAVGGKYFQGTLNGGGHSVRGLYYKGSDSKVGFIPAAKGTVSVSDIRFDDTYIESDGTALATLIGYADGGSFNVVKCYIRENNTVKSTNTTAGGIIGGGTGEFTVEDSAVLSDRTATANTGAIAASVGSAKVTVKNTFAKGVLGNDPGQAASAVNCYTDTADTVYKTQVCEAAKMQGPDAATAMPDLDWKNVWTVRESGYPEYRVTEAEESKIWDGTVAKRYAGGTGTAADPYQIAFGSQLAKMAADEQSTGKYYVLVEDIWLNDTTAENWKDTATQWLWNSNQFAGHLDGAGHTVRGLYFNGKVNKVGLFCLTKNATIRQLTVADSELVSTGFGVGTLIGHAIGGTTISDCVVEDSVTVRSTYNTDGEKGAGGFVGYSGDQITIEGSAFVGTVEAPGNAGAFLGNCWTAAVIKNSFSTAAVLFRGKGANNDSTSANNYSAYTGAQTGTQTVAAEQMKGKDALTHMPLLNGWAATEKYPVRFYSGVAGEVWSGVSAISYAAGTGTQSDPYIIETAEQLAYLVKDTSTGGKYYQLAADIRLNDTSAENWKDTARPWIVSTAIFGGIFSGNGHTISGLYYNGSESRVGLFRYAKDATIKRVTVDQSYVYTTGFGPALLVGQAHSGTVSFSECQATETTYVESTYVGNDSGVGGLVGYGGGSVQIENSAFTGKVAAPGNPGAFVGNCWGTVSIRGSFATAGVRFCTKKGLTEPSGNYGTADEPGVTKLTQDQMKGEAARTNMPGLNWTIVWATTEGYPRCRFLDPNGTPGAVWTGLAAESYAGGDGSEKNPYLIATGEQLVKMVQDAESAGKFYKIIEDIRLNDTTAENWKDSATQWIWNNNIFQGNVNGDCHTVSGLYYNGTNSKVGLFCYAKNATIRRIVLTESSIYTTGFAAGSLVGDANSGEIKIAECYVTETVSVESTYDASNDKGAGGIVGYGGAVIAVDTCAFLGTVKAPVYAGTILGNVWGTVTVKNSFSLQPSKFSPKKGLSGSSINNYGTATEAESGVTAIAAEKMLGAAAKTNMPLFNWERAWKTTDRYPVLNVGEYEGVPGQVWGGRLASGFAGGTGKIDDPYLISTPEQLAYLVNDLYASVGNYYKLTDDIYLNDVKNSNWEKNNPNSWFWVSGARTGNFNGHFDGDGHVVYGLYLDLKQTTDVVYAGLFPSISDGTVIERVGIANAHMKVRSELTKTESYVGGIAGYVFFNKADSTYVDTPVVFPKISQCFGDKTVTLEADFCGGIVAGAPRPADISDCYFIGKLNGERVGGIVGNSWTEYPGATVTHCYSATADADLLGNGRASVTNSATPINYTENYANSTGLGNMVTQISLLMMRGEAAYKNMPALDFENVWYALPNGTPVLRIFGTTDRFSNTSDPKPIEVSFVSNGGTTFDPIYGNPEEKMDIPIPVREGYIFDGWYVYRQLDFKFDIDYFPYFDQVLYAKWVPNGEMQDFEEYPDTMYDTGRDYEYYLPGTVGYNANYVRNGTASMHRIGATAADSDFLLMYETLLTVGKQYTMTFWTTTDVSGTAVDLSLVYENWPDVYDSDSGVEFIKRVTLQQGEWQKVEFTFIARTQWVAMRTSGNASVFFDDFMFTPVSDTIHPVNTTENTKDNTTDTDNTGTADTPQGDPSDTTNEPEKEPEKGGKVKKRRKILVNGEDNSPLVPILIASGVAVVLIAGAVVAIVIVKRRKSGKKGTEQ